MPKVKTSRCMDGQRYRSIISRKTDWFSEIKRDDVAAWNAKIDEKLARKEAKKAAKAEKLAAKNEKIGAHEESAPGKHFKQ